MKQYSKEKVYEVLTAQGVLPMFCHEDIYVCKSLLQAVYDAGARVVEFTNRKPNSLEVFNTLKKYADKKMPGLLLGAGTVMNVKEAKAFAKLDAGFIISPVIDKGVAKFCKEEKIFWCPGAATLTEIVHAQDLGAGLVKLVPAVQLGGPEFVKAVMAPCPWIKIMPTGGVNMEAENLLAWFQSGVKCVGIGSQLFSKDIIENGKYDLVTMQLSQMLQTVKAIRKEQQ